MIPHPLCTNYRIIFTPTASKNLTKLDKHANNTILEKVKQLAAGQSNLDVKKLTSSQFLYRLRAGDYRIIYQIAHKILTVHIVDVGHRKDIYKKFK